MKAALAQLNPTVGDLAGNLARILAAYQRASAQGAELVVFAELVIPGYPPKDLCEEPAFVDANRRALDDLAARIGETPAIVGFIDRRDGAGPGRPIYNAAAVLERGAVRSIHRKALLPTYDVFDEHRHFEPATEFTLALVRGRRVGVTICEDAWNDPDFWPRRLYTVDPVAELARQGAELLVNISASPFTLEKRELRTRMLAAHARKHRRPLLFCNQVGGNDDLVFDGHSLAFDEHGDLLARGAELDEDLVFVDTERKTGDVRAHPTSDAAAAFAALVLGTRDYARKCGFGKAVIGLSGGIDSSLVAAVAASALGPENVLGVAMPSRYSSEGSRSDAAALAGALGIRYQTIPIEPMFEAFLKTLGMRGGQTEENIQARIRGTILMALSNQLDHLVLSTGNKSEIGVGYCTLYGDMAGGLAVISDLPKTMVYRVARHVNESAGREIIPEAVFRKPPSAELRPDQKDEDSLPPYDVLDRLLEQIVEHHRGRAELTAAGFDARLVDDVERMIRRNEYKRRQMAPGLKITSKSFGPGRRYPIAQAWKG